jgi:hypothetical protein
MTNLSILRLHTGHDASLDTILDHLARYRLTDFSTLQRLPEFQHLKPGHLHRLLREGRRQQLMDSAPLYQGTRYWYLQAAGAAERAMPAQRSGPLSEGAKLRAYAMLQFCCWSRRPRYLLTAEELKQHLPMAYRPGLPSGYYFDPSGHGTLGLLRIDATGKGRWDRVLQSVRQDIHSHFLSPAFRQVVTAGRFEITIITVLPQKAARLREALASFPDAHRVPVEITAVPQLLPLTAPSRRKETATRHSR